MDNLQIDKRAFFLAYEASFPVGMGILQARNDATEDQVWEAGYDGKSSVNGDYVFGRMMKLGIKWTPTTIEVTWGREPNPEYQGWARKYHSSADLLEAAMDSLTKPVSS